MPEYDGYIADVPNAVFTRCDGRIFGYDKLSQFENTVTNNTANVNGGQSNFP